MHGGCERQEKGKGLFQVFKLDLLKEQIFHLPSWGRQWEEQVQVLDTQRQDGSVGWEPKIKVTDRGKM